MRHLGVGSSPSLYSCAGDKGRVRVRVRVRLRGSQILAFSACIQWHIPMSYPTACGQQPPALCPARQALHPPARTSPCLHPSWQLGGLWHDQHCLTPCQEQPRHCWAPYPSCRYFQQGFTGTSPTARRIQDTLGHGCGMCQDEDTGRVRACCRMNQGAESSHQGWTQAHSGSWAGKAALTMATVVLPAGWGCQGLGASSSPPLGTPGSC